MSGSLSKRLVDRRAFAGALAILMVGVQLTIMMAVYFIPGGEAFALLQSRWWWEIALNLQILCLALMWMCHSERIGNATGWRKFRAISRLISGFAGVSTPFWTLVVCAWNDWFHHKPDQDVLIYFGSITFGAWIGIAYGVPLLVQLFMRGRHFFYMAFGASSPKKLLITFSPFLLLLLLTLEEVLRGGNLHLVMWPLATYIHCAIPYLYRAFTRVEGRDASAVAGVVLPTLPPAFRQ